MAWDDETGTNFGCVIARSQVSEIVLGWAAADAPVV